MIRRFIRLNNKISNYFLRILPQEKIRKENVYLQEIKNILNESEIGLKILDIGAGKNSLVSPYKNGHILIGIDVSDEEIKQNTALDEYHVADVTKKMPFKDSEMDLIVSHSALEHLKNLDFTVSSANRILKQGGYFINQIPSKFAPFAVINQLLPEKLSHKLLFFLRPEVKDKNGFEAHYDRCYYTGIRKLLIKNKFTIEKHYVFYGQSVYFRFFFPLFALVALYELVIYYLGIKNLCASMVIVAKKESDFVH